MVPHCTSPTCYPEDVLHDLRTPLTVLLGQVQLLRHRHAAGRAMETLDHDLATIEPAALALAAMLERAPDRQPADP